jgi:putative ABC transport system permease protein
MTHFRETLRIALHCMRAGRLRTALTMLGIVLSISLVIAMHGLNTGVQHVYGEALDSLVSPITVASTAAIKPGGNGPRTLTDDDVAALSQQSDPSVIRNVIPMLNGQAGIRRGAIVRKGGVLGTSTNYLPFNNGSVAAGSMFTEDQYRDSARVTLLGSSLATELFGGNFTAAVGSSIFIGRQEFTVIGVLAPVGRADFAAMMPVTTARSVLYGSRRAITGIGVLAADMGLVPSAVKQIREIMDRRHYVDESGHRDFSVSVTQNNITTASALLNVLEWFTLGLTAIALLIGALGLANIMLITVTDRTPEIGIRKAIGARRGAILRQFLIEAMLIAGIGGLIGVALGVGLTVTGQYLLPRYAPMWGVPALSIPAIVIAFGISLVIGLLAGCYPAVRAARLCPMDALRH